VKIFNPIFFQYNKIFEIKKVDQSNEIQWNGLRFQIYINLFHFQIKKIYNNAHFFLLVRLLLL
jgi:hypothetical protein